MRYYAVFDTNVLISSLLTKRTDTATAQVIDAISIGDIISLYNREILSEYDEVLHRAKFSFSEERIRRIIRHFPERSFIVTPSEMMTIIQKGQK